MQVWCAQAPVEIACILRRSPRCASKFTNILLLQITISFVCKWSIGKISCGSRRTNDLECIGFRQVLAHIKFATSNGTLRIVVDSLNRRSIRRIECESLTCSWILYECRTFSGQTQTRKVNNMPHDWQRSIKSYKFCVYFDCLVNLFLLQEQFGDHVWKQALRATGCKHTVFNTHQIYPDSLMPDLAEALSAITYVLKLTVKFINWKQKNTHTKSAPVSFSCVVSCSGESFDFFMNYFGKCFVRFFTNFGYDKMLKATGRYFCDFLQSVDNIHLQMRFTYPKMKSPSMQLTETDENGAVLVYRSGRCGFSR